MHILQLVPELSQGGVERGTVELSRELVKQGVRSTVVSAGGTLVPEIEKDGARHHAAPVASKNLFTVPFRVARLRKLLRAIDPDLIHVRSRVPAWLSRFANRSLRKPWITTVHGFNSVNAYSAIMTRGDRVICVSEAVRAYVEQHYGVEKERLCVIPRGIDLDHFDPRQVRSDWIQNFRDEHHLCATQPIVSSIGRLTGLKDYETFLRCFTMLRKNRPEIRGLIVGGTHPARRHYAGKLHRLHQELKLEGIVHFIDHVGDIREIYALSDVIVSASKKPESFGRTCAEALAMERPVVATCHGGVLEIIQEGRHGFFVPIEDPERLAEAILNAFQLPRLGFREHIAAHFSLAQMVEKNLALYRAVLQPAFLRP